MKIINFERVELNRLDGQLDVANIKESLGNLLHNNAIHIPIKKLAEKIYYSSGDTEFTEEECAMLNREIKRDDLNILLRVREKIEELTLI